MSDSDSDSGEMGGVEATVWPHPENVTLSMNADRLVNIVDTDTDGEVPEDIQKLVDCLDCGASAHQWLSTWQGGSGHCNTAQSQHEQANKNDVPPREEDRVSDSERATLNELYPSVMHTIQLLQHSVSRPMVATPEIMTIFYSIIRVVFKDHVQYSGGGATYAVARPLQDHPPLDPQKYRMADIIVLSPPIAAPSAIPRYLRSAHAYQATDMADDGEEGLMGPPRTEPAKTTAATISAAGSTTDVDMEDAADQIDREAQLIRTESDKPQGPAALVVAQLGELPSLLASAVYHRQYLGFSDPVIGVGFSKMRGNVRVVIAWLDHQKEDEVGLRGIRLAPLSSQKFPGADFDLTSPADVLRLALFLLRAQNITHTTTPTDFARPWRADTWAPHAVHSTKGNIAQWVDDVQGCPAPSTVDSEDLASNLEEGSEVASVA
ncbi:hypothetical protein EV715DRAFT_254728 [Schizophyllum commune]